MNGFWVIATQCQAPGGSARDQVHQVNELVQGFVRSLVWDSVQDSVSTSVWNSVRDEARITVWRSAWNSVQAASEGTNHE